MAHITEIKIAGLLGRTNSIHLELNRDINVFFGENGCGKTTLLKVLDAALSRDGAAMEQLAVTKAVVDIFSIEEDRVIKHVWERSTASAHQINPQDPDLLQREFVETSEGRILVAHSRKETAWKLTPKLRKQTSGVRWAHTFLPTTRLYLSNTGQNRTLSQRSQLSELQLDQAFSESVNRAWLQFYSKALNEVRSIQESGLRTVLR